MKRILKVLILIISFMIGITNAETLVDSDDVKYGETESNTNLRMKLDELISKADSLVAGGNAQSYEIRYGKTALVNGKFITGTKKPNQIYFKSGYSSFDKVYINNMEVTYKIDSINLNLIYNNGQKQLKIASDTSTKSYGNVYLYKLSEKVLMVQYSLDQTVTDNDNEYSYYDMTYISTYIYSNNTFSLVRTVNVSAGRGNTTDYKNYFYNKEYYTEYGTEIESEYYVDFAAIAVDRPYTIYINTYGSYTSETVTSTTDKETVGSWYASIAINTLTGAITEGSIKQGTSTYDYVSGSYSGTSRYVTGNFGLIQETYANKDFNFTRDNPTKITYYDIYNNTMLSSNNVTSTYYDDNYLSREQLTNIYYGTSYYGHAGKVYTNNKKFTFSLDFAKFGSNSVNANYYVNPEILNETITYDLTNNVPNNVKINDINSVIYFYSQNRYYVTLNCTVGKVYAIISLVEDSGSSKGIYPVIESVSYREAEDGSLINTVSNVTGYTIEFYQ